MNQYSAKNPKTRGFYLIDGCFIPLFTDGAQNYHKIRLCQHKTVDKNCPVKGKPLKYKSIFVSEC